MIWLYVIINVGVCFQTDVYEVCPHPLVLAQQLTHIELERLSMIGPEEFVQAFAKETEVQVRMLVYLSLINLFSTLITFSRKNAFFAIILLNYL